MCEPSQRLEISEDEKDELGKKLLLHETEFRNVAAGQRKQAETMAKLREVCQPFSVHPLTLKLYFKSKSIVRFDWDSEFSSQFNFNCAGQKELSGEDSHHGV